MGQTDGGMNRPREEQDRQTGRGMDNGMGQEGTKGVHGETGQARGTWMSRWDTNMDRWTDTWSTCTDSLVYKHRYTDETQGWTTYSSAHLRGERSS